MLPNREGGQGYADIVIEIFAEKTGIVTEVKYAENADLEAGCREALEQIERKGYAGWPGHKMRYRLPYKELQGCF